MAILTVVLLLSTSAIVTDALEGRHMPECNTTFMIPNMYNNFKMNGVVLDEQAIVIEVLESNKEGCSFNATKIKHQLTIPDTENMFIDIILLCRHNHPIHVFDGGIRYDNIISILQVNNCIINVKDWINLGGIFDTRVNTIHMSKRKPVDKSQFTENDCERLQSIGTFSLDTVELPENSHSFEDIFWCSTAFPLMTEVMFKNLSWEGLPNRFMDKFPNLQSLDIPYNNFTIPPSEFPWTNDTFNLPRNLSRTPFLDDHYSKSIGLNIPPFIYRRIYNLDNNNIEDLSDFSFHGFLHKISVKGNGLRLVGSNTFREVRGLQALDLSFNSLEELPEGLFQNMHDVTRIDLSNNALKYISKTILTPLISVSIIQLSKNNLTSIAPGALSMLHNLTELHLEYNNLEHLSPDSFPLDSLTLKTIYLNHNPIHSLPEFIFWFRTIEFIDLSHAAITFDNFTSFIENMDTNRVMNGIVDSASSSNFDDLMTRAETLRKIDLSHNDIKQVNLSSDSSSRVKKMLHILLLHYEFVLDDNPLACDCSIIPITKLIHGLLLKKKIDRNEYYFTDWVCQTPSELYGAKMLDVQPEQTYCPISIDGCPTQCSCFKRTVFDSIIVDCRSLGLQEMHSLLPNNHNLELWYSENNITDICSGEWQRNVVSLDLGHNKLKELRAETMDTMVNLKQLFLHDNLLAYLPSQIKDKKLRNITLYPNPFHCDCNSLWLKRWLMKKKATAYDKVTCNLQDKNDGKVFVEVPDDEFTCPDDVDYILSVVVPSVVCSVTLALILIFLFILYAYRLEVKVLLFVYFGIHPFDKDFSDGTEEIDCVVVHSGSKTDWVMQSIVEMLESENYRYIVCDMDRDFIIGFSFQENINKIIRRSKRIIFCLSDDWCDSTESFNIAWSIAQDKIKESKSHFAILITHGVSSDDIENKELRLFIKHGRYVDSQDRLFCNKILYYMPSTRGDDRADSKVEMGILKGRKSKEISRCFVNRYCEEDIRSGTSDVNTVMPKAMYAPSHAFVSYADDDIQYVLDVLKPCLEDNGFRLIIPDRDFVVGASKEENVLHAINCSQRTLFLLSEKHCRDEWSLFTFRAAFEKSLRDQMNHLLIIIKEDVAAEYLDSELAHYLNNYICLHTNDRWFEKKLLNGMPLLKHSKNLHTSPMFISEEVFDDTSAADVEVEIDGEAGKQRDIAGKTGEHCDITGKTGEQCELVGKTEEQCDNTEKTGEQCEITSKTDSQCEIVGNKGIQCEVVVEEVEQNDIVDAKREQCKIVGETEDWEGAVSNARKVVNLADDSAEVCITTRL